MPSNPPNGGDFPSRFSTPVNELDDHRFQAESLPRVDQAAIQQRRGTAGSTVNGERQAPFIQLNDGSHPIGRDFENAIVFDDDKSDNVISPHDGPTSHRPSASPVASPREFPQRRRGTFSSDRSSSPPNSIDAFAEGRVRPRTGTLQSLEPPALQPTTSHSTFARVRGLSEDHGTIRTADRQSDQGSVEDDICFPQDELPPNGGWIDFMDLEELVEKQILEQTQEPVQVPRPLRRRQSVSCRSGMNHLAPPSSGRKTPMSPRILAQMLGPRKESETDTSTDDIADEKAEAQAAATAAAGDQDAIGNDRREPLHRFSFFSSALQDSVHTAQLGDLLMEGETFQQLFRTPEDGGCWWLDMVMPTELEVEHICKAFGIHGLTREDIQQQETREKVELFKSYYFVCFRSFFQMDKTAKDYLEPVNVYAVVFREGILTFTFRASPHASNVRKRMGRLRDYIALSSDWICYALIDDIVDSFGPAIQDTEQRTDGIEESVFTARSEDSRELLREIGECRKDVMSLLRLLGGKADVIKGFAKRCNEAYSVAPRSDVGLYLSDIQDHVVTMMSNLGHADHVLSRSHANYLAQISVDNIMQGTRANEVLSKITFLASILVPLNLVCGLFGMNVPVPGGVNPGSLAWFFGIVGVLVAFVCSATALARWKRFI